MGFFDIIERRIAAKKQSTSPAAPATATETPKCQALDHHQDVTADGGHDTWRPSAEEIAERRRILNRKPERLSFLVPCQVCHGRAFIHIDGGGFVCRTCHPGLFGHPVEAAGPDLPPPTTNYEMILASDHHQKALAIPASNDEPTKQQRAHFAAPWPWIKENKTALLAAGWTMDVLVRRARYRWPYGPWGVAWLPVWSRPGVEVTIGQRGEIVFTYSSCGRVITQAAHVSKSQNITNLDR